MGGSYFDRERSNSCRAVTGRKDMTETAKDTQETIRATDMCFKSNPQTRYTAEGNTRTTNTIIRNVTISVNCAE